MTFIREESAFVLPLPKTPIICNTDGRGYWSCEARAVRVNKVVVSIHRAEVDLYKYHPVLYVNVDAYFPKSSWDTNEHGLIYTDRLWLKEFNKAMKGINRLLFGSGIYYTEQGMQERDYVSMSMSLTSFPQIKRFDCGLTKIKNLKWLKDEQTIFGGGCCR
jgi:hypothetical protein